MQPSNWVVGPPAPAGTAWLARAAYLGAFSLVVAWVAGHLGGVALRPENTSEEGANDTSKLFNWHPILMTLAFVVFMSEAVMAYRAPLSEHISRPKRKLTHVCLHTLAALAAVLGVTAVWKSHSLKLPSAMANLYSPHSYMGLTALALGMAQYVLGMSAYLYPKWSLADRMALAPLHR